MDSFLQFWVKNNALIIDLTFLIAIPLGIYVLYRSLKEDNKETSANAKVTVRRNKFSEEDSQSLEKLSVPIKEVTDKAEKLPEDIKNEVSVEKAVEPAAGAAEAAETTPVNNPEKDALVQDLKSKISHLEEQISNNTNSPDDDEELIKKIQELEEKLGEYEIIEDDIANLSFYKNENQKLIDMLKEAGIEFESQIPSSKDENKLEDPAPEVSAKEKRPQEGDHMKEFEQVVNASGGGVQEEVSAEETGESDSSSGEEAEEVDLSEEMILAAVGEELVDDSGAAESDTEKATPAEESSAKVKAQEEAPVQEEPPKPPEGPKDLIAEFENFVKNS